MIAANTFKDIQEWASAIERKFKGRFRLKLAGETWLFNQIAIAMFHTEADSTISSSDVIEVARFHGMAFSREARYFFIYDKKKRFLMLQLYPHTGENEVTNESTNP